MTTLEMTVTAKMSRREYDRFMGLRPTVKEPRRHMGRLRKLTREDREKRQQRRERNGKLTGHAKVRAKWLGGKEVPS